MCLYTADAKAEEAVSEIIIAAVEKTFEKFI
jgi:hypothetical protein